MKKFDIMPKVTVYKDVFTKEELDEFIKIIDKSENSIEGFDTTRPEESAYNDNHGTQPIVKDDSSIIATWTPWYTFGSRSKMNRRPLDLSEENNNKEQFMLREKVYSAYNKVHNDYIKTWGGQEGWPDFVDCWISNMLPGHKLTLCDVEILKHRMVLDQELALQFHTDRHEHRINKASIVQIITYTMYLNDDYEGGELEFIEEDGDRLITYKPKAGDVTAFPSGLPYWHAARSVTSGRNKLFLRVFAVWDYEGSEEYRSNVEKYGKEIADKIEMDRGRDIVDSGDVGRQVVREGERYEPSKNLIPLFVTKDNHTYIDGREL